MLLSSFLYFIGVVGGIGGIIVAMKETISVSPTIGILTLLVSIAILWIGVLLESIEESYFAAGA
ncbi:hypothetical protein [Halomicrobium katesii]|uniref:hypothetical protein n=1 Tax=Halomicrobium katesii TaxID=437163 RepID=UPI000368F570|nr:hypothetical protein [Halomicrobium katesii]